jgi:hypothetical protein
MKAIIAFPCPTVGACGERMARPKCLLRVHRQVTTPQMPETSRYFPHLVANFDSAMRRFES